MKAAGILLLTALEKENDVMKMTNAALTMDFLEEIKRVAEVLLEAMQSVCFIYNASFRDLKVLQDDGGGEALVETVQFLLCDFLYNTSCPSE